MCLSCHLLFIMYTLGLLKEESVALLVGACKHNIQIGPLLPGLKPPKVVCTYTACANTASYAGILHLFKWKSWNFGMKFCKLVQASLQCLGPTCPTESRSVFIPSLSFSAQKRLRVKLRFAVILEWALSACRFASPGLFFLFFCRYSHICNFLCSEWHPVTVLLASPVCYHLLGQTHPLPVKEKSWQNQNFILQAEGGALQMLSPPIGMQVATNFPDTQKFNFN